MAIRLRSIAMLLGVVVALLAPAAVDVAPSSGAGEQVVAVTAPAIARATAVVRTSPLRAAAPVVLAAAAIVVLLLLVLLGVVGPVRRRIGDVGDRWRALLLGAPPTSA